MRDSMDRRETPRLGAGWLPLVLALLSLACAGGGLPGPDPDPGSPPTSGVVYLVRHAETVGEGAERPLSAAGRARAEALADRLAGAGVERVLSTEYPRTEETAAPLAARLGLPVEPYDPAALAALAAALAARGGTTLVVGHSNTTPELVELLGGEPGPPIDHAEHDRLYRVELPSGATNVERYGRKICAGSS